MLTILSHCVANKGLPEYTHTQLLCATDNCAKTNLLGVGGFGEVDLER